MTASHILKLVKYLVYIGVLILAAGCATTQNNTSWNSHDPLEPANRTVFNALEKLDKQFIKPVAESYVSLTPVPVRTSVSNFFDNLSYLNVIFSCHKTSMIRSFLQIKIILRRCFTRGARYSCRIF